MKGVSSLKAETEPYVLFLSRINWKKGLERLISAWKFVPGKLLIIAGNDEEGYEEGLKAQAVHDKVADRIRFIGPVSGVEEVASCTKTPTCLFCPHCQKILATLFWKLWLRSCPVVVTPGVGMSATVEKEQCGLVVDGAPEVLGPAIPQPAARKKI